MIVYNNTIKDIRFQIINKTNNNATFALCVK